MFKISNQFVTAFELEEDLFGFNLNALPSIQFPCYDASARLNYLISSRIFSSLFDIIIAIILIRGTSFHHHYWRHHLITPII